LAVKVDLHTHSVASPDGSLTEENYAKMLESGLLDHIAVTDHGTIEFAEKLRDKLGENIIVGQEILATEGDIIGLYLKKSVRAGLSVAETVAEIKGQGGLVYIPHPFESVRKGLPLETLNLIAGQVDIVETDNGRAVFQNKSAEAKDWALQHKLPGAASSDAHGWQGWGRTYSEVPLAPTAATLPKLLMAATYAVSSPGLHGVLYPKLNRLLKRLFRRGA
jgi:predicted metal-dependent phosphoesterase TrpH